MIVSRRLPYLEGVLPKISRKPKNLLKTLIPSRFFFLDSVYSIQYSLLLSPSAKAKTQSRTLYPLPPPSLYRGGGEG